MVIIGLAGTRFSAARGLVNSPGPSFLILLLHPFGGREWGKKESSIFRLWARGSAPDECRNLVQLFPLDGGFKGARQWRSFSYWSGSGGMLDRNAF